jgi:hypothetical protein
MASIRENVWRQRSQFMFDTHVEELVSFFRNVMERHSSTSTEKVKATVTATIKEKTLVTSE